MPIDTVILSLTPVCNLSCVYCQNEPPFREFPKLPMDLELVRKLIIEYVDFVDKEKDTNVLRFCYSGGEPLTVGIEYFEKIIKLQQELVKDSFCIENIVQTNGTLIDSNWANFFRAHNIHVSVTIDGPADIHDSQRPMRAKDTSSLEKVVKGIESLRSANVSFGTLTVVTENSVHHAKEIFDFISSFEPNMMGFLPCVDRGPFISPKDFGYFMIDLFDIWLEKRNPKLLVREFTHIIQGMLNIPHTKGCQYAGDCPLHVNIAPDGAISVCDQYIGKPNGYLGNIKFDNLTTIVNSERYIQFRNCSRLLTKECNDCRYVTLCNGGCTYRRNNFKEPDYLCEARIMMFTHIEKRMESIVSQMLKSAREKNLCA